MSEKSDGCCADLELQHWSVVLHPVVSQASVPVIQDIIVRNPRSSLAFQDVFLDTWVHQLMLLLSYGIGQLVQAYGDLCRLTQVQYQQYFDNLSLALPDWIRQPYVLTCLDGLLRQALYNRDWHIADVNHENNAALCCDII